MRSVQKNKVFLLAEKLRSQLKEPSAEKTLFKSARETAQEFKVSRQTADRALRLLAEEGILTRIPGAGTWKNGVRKKFRIACTPPSFPPGPPHSANRNGHLSLG